MADPLTPVLDALNHRVLIWDGAIGTQFQRRDPGSEAFVLDPDGSWSGRVAEAAQRLGGRMLDGCNEILNLTRPDLVESIHADYFAAGSDMVETNTFGATSIVLAEYEIPELVFEISLAAAQIARRAADRFQGKFVAGALGPGTKLVSLGQTTWEELESTYTTGFTALIEGGVDVLLLETLQDLLMVKAGVVAAKRAMAETGKRLPLIVQVTMEQTGTMLLGSEMGAALAMLEQFPEVVAVGMNCATGPVEMGPHVRFLSQFSTRPLSVQPNAGLPVMERGQAVYKLTPEELAQHHEHFVRGLGVAMVGGCCGTTPDHIRAVKASVDGLKPSPEAHWQKVRRLFPGFDFTIKTQDQAEAKALIGAASLYQFQPYRQDNSFLIIGEKTNANGSKAFREMLAAENWDGLTEVARELEAEGSHMLDVCTAYVGRDEVRDMTTLLRSYNQHITVPIMIDSTEVPVIEAALQCLAGKPVVNSINFEDGEGRTRAVLELCRKYGAAVVALTIDEQGMAKTVDKKVEIAERTIAFTREYGLPDHDVFFDCLTFTLGSGDEEFRKSATATLDAIRQIRSLFPTVNTTLGVSNVSFGLKPAARMVLNSVFLHSALEAGLTSAIVHYSRIRPESQIDSTAWKVASDLVFDRRRVGAA
ncbi:MAG: homocysteine S-methyltransferase family protein [Fimbriimonadaceae bacterium]|nr:homocysteine S-methyltransferase family protein [Fimbriimonadaceae bacterium]QYK59395.1 MAG: homocysteine S-methyltransferase family protein [Fimbriimonadaceae bacterium]